MPDTDRRDPANMALRARIERLRALHRELQAVSASAADTAVQTARGVPSETANRQLNVLVQKQTQQLRQLLRSLAQDAPDTLDSLLTPEELTALLGPGPSADA